MDGTYQTFGGETGDVTLGDRLDRLTRLEAIFTTMAKEFPANRHLAMQADAMRGAAAGLREVVAQKGPFATDYDAELSEAAALFQLIGAGEADLQALDLA